MTFLKKSFFAFSSLFLLAIFYALVHIPISAPLLVTAPRKNDQWKIGTTHSITWETGSMSIKKDYFLVFSLSRDGAYRYIGSLQGSEIETRNYDWTIRTYTSDDIISAIEPGKYRLIAVLYSGSVCRQAWCWYKKGRFFGFFEGKFLTSGESDEFQIIGTGHLTVSTTSPYQTQSTKTFHTSVSPSSGATTSDATQARSYPPTFFSDMDFSFSHPPAWTFERNAQLTTEGQIAWHISMSSRGYFATLIAAPLETAYDSCGFFTNDVERTYYRQNVGTPIEVLVCKLCPDASKAKEEKCDAATKSVRIEVLWQRGTNFVKRSESGQISFNPKQTKDIRLIQASSDGYNGSSEELIRELKKLAKTIHVTSQNK